MQAKLIFCCFVLWAVLPCSAQTYKYKAIYRVERSTEVKNEAHGEIYVTFVKGKQSCYRSDKKGIASDGGHSYSYQGRLNGNITYKCDKKTYGGGEVIRIDTEYFSFTDDYSRMNIWLLAPEYPQCYSAYAVGAQIGYQIGSSSSTYKQEDWVWVYERVVENEKAIPNKMY